MVARIPCTTAASRPHVHASACIPHNSVGPYAAIHDPFSALVFRCFIVAFLPAPPPSFTLALLGTEVLDLETVDSFSPETLLEHHALLRDYNAGDASLRQAARDRLASVNGAVLAMMDSSRSERRAVSFFYFFFLLFFFVSFLFGPLSLSCGGGGGGGAFP